MPEQNYTQDDYERDFLKDKKIQLAALNAALDIRKFEIELYWKRASYFWTFIGATLAGYVAVQAISDPASKQELSVVLSCLGMVFSVAWVLVNRGSKHWQENWEKHVDLLEDTITGPLYKVVLTRNDPQKISEHFRHLITGPSSFSVSKINQIISLFVTALWLCLLVKSLPVLDCSMPINVFYFILVTLSVISIILFFWLGKSYSGGFWHKGSYRTTKINNTKP